MPLTEVTDPNKLESVRAAFSGKAVSPGVPSGGLKEITDPSVLESVKSQFETKPVSQQKTELVNPAEEEQWLPEVLKPVSKGLGLARELLMGETVAKAPSLILGDQPRTGAQTSRELETERRSMLPEYRKLQGTGTNALQAAANTAADSIAMVGGKYALPIELGVVAGRHLGQVAGALATDIPVAAYRAGFEAPARAMFGDVSANALALQQERNEYATMRAAKETARGYTEFGKGLAFGLSPAAFEAGRTLVEGGGLSDAFDAGTEALKAYPLASIMPGIHAAKYAGKRGGAPLVREGQPVQTITGKPIVTNKFGETMFEPITTAEKAVEKVAGRPIEQIPAIGDTVKDVVEWGKRNVEPAWQRMTYDAVTPKDVTRQQGITAANQILMSGESPAAQKLRIAVDQHGLLRDMQTELADPKFKGATDIEKFQAIEGTLGDTKQLTEAPVMDAASRAAAQELGELFVQHGMPVDLAQKAVPYAVLEGVRYTKQGRINDPLVALHDSLAQIKNMTPADAQARVAAYSAIVAANMKDPNFIAAADQVWAGKGYRWVPGSEVRQRNGYAEAIREVQKEAAAQGRPHFDLSVPELGELRKDYTFQLYDKLISDLDSTPVGRKQLMQLLISSPIARMAANPTSPVHVQALAAWHSQPGGARARLAERLNDLSTEMVSNYGLSPATVLRHHDRWLSRAFTDAIDGQLNLSSYIDTMAADARLVSKIQRQVDSSRFRRKLSADESNKRFMDMVTNGDISLHDALASTVASSMIMANHLNNLSQIHDVYQKIGLLSDTQKPGMTKVPETLAAPTRQAASPDPYNYAYGKLAGKWVDKQVATQINLIPSAMRKATEAMPYLRAFDDFGREVLGLTRFAKTTANAIVYPIRNAISDAVIPWAASGESPYSGYGRKLNLDVTADVDRMVRTRGQSGGMVMSPLLREAYETGILNPDKIPNDSALPSAIRSQVQTMVKKVETMVESATDPAERVKALAHAAMYIKAMGTAGAKEIPLAAMQAWQEAYRATKATAADPQTGGKGIAAARAPSEFLSAFNDNLTNIVLSQVIAKMETKRAMWAFGIARNKLKLDKDRAAIFVRDTVYGVDRPSELMTQFNQIPLMWAANMTVLPLFQRYGIWQPKRSIQRALNDKNLWTNYMIIKGLDAMNEDDLMREPFLENNHRARLDRIHVQHVAAGDIGMGSVGGVQDFLRHAGVPEPVVSSVGKPNNIIAQDLTNLVSAQTFMHQYKPELEGIQFATQFGVFGGVIAQALDNNLQNPSYREQTGMMPGESKTIPVVARELMKSLIYHAFPASWITPIRPENPRSFPVPVPFVGRAAGVAEKMARAKLEERPAYKNVYGEEINPVDMFSREFGSFAPNIIDSASFQARLSRKLNAQAREIKQRAMDYLAHGISKNLPPEEQERLKKEANLSAGQKLYQLEQAYMWPEKYKSREEAVRKTKESAQKYQENMNKIRGND